MSELWDLAFKTIKELETENGILASGKEEIYGCIFGRDSLITCLKLIRAYQFTNDKYLLSLARKILINLRDLQGKEINIESGEQPGKCIHEYRPTNHERVTRDIPAPWYLYPDNIMRNYDSVDSTSLLLIAYYRYYQASGDGEFLRDILPSVNAGLQWIQLYGDSNGDGFVDYALPAERKFGGLKTQNWMDSEESLFHEDGSAIAFPIAPAEVQAYTYLALKLWSAHFAREDFKLSNYLHQKAVELKQMFNQKFVQQDADGIFIAAAIDGAGKALMSVRSCMGHVLWSSMNRSQDYMLDSILNIEYVPMVAKRLIAEDLFVPQAGVRTLSTKSRNFAANSYHNGSIWPHDNGMIAEGLENFGFAIEARQVRKAMLAAIEHFQTPIELFVYENNNYSEYSSDKGKACKKQAWSAASILTEIRSLNS